MDKTDKPPSTKLYDKDLVRTDSRNQKIDRFLSSTLESVRSNAEADDSFDEVARANESDDSLNQTVEWPNKPSKETTIPKTRLNKPVEEPFKMPATKQKSADSSALSDSIQNQNKTIGKDEFLCSESIELLT